VTYAFVVILSLWGLEELIFHVTKCLLDAIVKREEPLRKVMRG
jgi:hypothetical protein